MVNPYAPPKEQLVVPVTTPLPDGIRRYALEPVAFRRLVGRQLWLQRVRGLAVFVIVLGVSSALGSSTLSVPWLLGVYGGALVIGSLLGWLRARKVLDAQLGTFEVLASDRVVRRVFVNTHPAEVLRPEVSRLVETRLALWVLSDRPRSAIALTRAIAGYDELRATLATWGPIETIGGLRAFFFATRHVRQQRPRDAVGGTSLERDPSLQDELRTLRAVAIDRGMGLGTPANARSRLLRVLVLWVLLVVMFLAIWQFLQPSERRSRPRPPRPPPALTP